MDGRKPEGQYSGLGTRRMGVLRDGKGAKTQRIHSCPSRMHRAFSTSKASHFCVLEV